MKILQANTIHGVADRITLALRGWKLAQATGRTFQYIWCPHEFCNCDFDRLFATRHFPVLRDYPVSPALRIDRSTSSELVRNLPWMSANPICLYNLFGHNYDDFDAVFAPAPEVSAAVRDYQAQVFQAYPQVIGVHVRRTDRNKDTLPADPDYFRAIDPLLDRQPEAALFLASDDPAVEESFRSKYGQRVKTYPVRTYARSRPEGIVDAVIVLYLLRAASLVVAGVYSGYSLLAAWNRPFVKVATASSPFVYDWEGRPIAWPGSRRPAPEPEAARTGLSTLRRA